jgi:hypothetical protein
MEKEKEKREDWLTWPKPTSVAHLASPGRLYRFVITGEEVTIFVFLSSLWPTPRRQAPRRRTDKDPPRCLILIQSLF